MAERVRQRADGDETGAAAVRVPAASSAPESRPAWELRGAGHDVTLAKSLKSIAATTDCATPAGVVSEQVVQHPICADMHSPCMQHIHGSASPFQHPVHRSSSNPTKLCQEPEQPG